MLLNASAFFFFTVIKSPETSQSLTFKGIQGIFGELMNMNDHNNKWEPKSFLKFYTLNGL